MQLFVSRRHATQWTQAIPRCYEQGSPWHTRSWTPGSRDCCPATPCSSIRYKVCYGVMVCVLQPGSRRTVELAELEDPTAFML